MREAFCPTSCASSPTSRRSNCTHFTKSDGGREIRRRRLSLCSDDHLPESFKGTVYCASFKGARSLMSRDDAPT